MSTCPTQHNVPGRPAFVDMGLLDLLEAAAQPTAHLRLPADSDQTVGLDQVLVRADRAASRLRQFCGEGGIAGAVLSPSVDCFAFLLGAWKAGLTVASLPARARGESQESYVGRVNAMRTACDGAPLFCGNDELYSMGARPFEAATESGAPRRGDRGAPGFIQFTSGTSSEPKGVVLTLESISASLLAMLGARSPDGERVVSCSWLPLSHDLGLFGGVLCPWVGIGQSVCRDGEIVLLPTDAFLSNPSAWLAACSRYGATVTLAPNFALEVVARRLARSRSLDLSSLTTLAIGGEPISAATIRDFVAAAAPLGLDEDAICPGYGLAETTLAVSIPRRGERWTSTSVDADSLSDGRWKPSAMSDLEYVSCGRPLEGYDIRIRSTTGEVGPIEIRGPSLLSGYLGTDRSPLDDGWLATHDIGVIANGETYVLGRSDDVLVVAGRNIDSRDLERAVEAGSTFARPGCVAAVQAGDGYALVVELKRGAYRHANFRDLAAQFRGVLIGTRGTGPDRVVILETRRFPKTPSGKPQKRKLQADLATGRIEEYAVTVEAYRGQHRVRPRTTSDQAGGQ